MNRVRVVPFVWMCSALVLAACGGDDKKLELGGSCTLNSDCQEGLVCKFGACHKACMQTRDCPTGERCVQVDGVAVCQTQAESACHADATCTPPLVCRTVDNTCRSACTSTGTCLLGSQTCVGAVCVDTSELASVPDASAGGTDSVAGPDGGAVGPDAPPALPDSASPDVLPDVASADVSLSKPDAMIVDTRRAALDAAPLDVAVSILDSSQDSVCTPGAVVTFSDGTFNPGDWSEYSIQPTGGATAASVQISTDGNPDAYRRITHTLPANSSIWIAYIYLQGVYDPKIGGAIDHIDYSEDQIEFSPPFSGAAIGWAMFIVQDGRIFSATSSSDAFTNLSWKRAKLSGLTAADFSNANIPDGGSIHPDFSTSGAPIAFGFVRSNTTSFSITTTHGIDNWSVAIYPKCQ
jgi:hypothetical protein